MKVLVNRLRGLVDVDVVEDLAQPVFKLLHSMLSDNEETKVDEAEVNGHKKKGSTDHHKE
jgi:hypothetical protein